MLHHLVVVQMSRLVLRVDLKWWACVDVEVDGLVRVLVLCLLLELRCLRFDYDWLVEKGWSASSSTCGQALADYWSTWLALDVFHDASWFVSWASWGGTSKQRRTSRWPSCLLGWCLIGLLGEYLHRNDSKMIEFIIKIWIILIKQNTILRIIEPILSCKLRLELCGGFRLLWARFIWWRLARLTLQIWINAWLLLGVLQQ
jgi:hypothetical protein